jgi:hypothetical protein
MGSKDKFFLIFGHVGTPIVVKIKSFGGEMTKICLPKGTVGPLAIKKI